MRTTSLPRARAVVAALRTRPVAVATTAMLAAGLFVGVIDTATAQAAHSATSNASSSGTIVNGRYISSNRISTASFENYQKPWTGTQLYRQRWATPDGRWVARVTSRGGHSALDDWPGDASNTVQGWTYTGSMIVANATSRNWNTPISLVIREHTGSGTYVASRTVSTRLRWGFQKLTVSLIAAHAGDYVDIYLFQSGIPEGSSFVADEASLVYSHPVAPTNPTPPPPPPPPTGDDSPSTLGLLAYDTGQPAALGDTSRYQYVVVQENQFAHIAEIKRMNPDTKVLAYMEAAGTHNTGSCPDSTSPHLNGDSYGVNYCWANRYHPDWFLTDRTGKRMNFVDYPSVAVMDVGNPLYAASWAQGSYANLKQDGFDGIWMDDVNVYPGHGLDGRIAKYTDEQYGSATTAFASTVGDYFRSRGMLAIANVGMDPWTSWQLSDTLSLGKHLTAVNREHYVRYGDICGPFGERFNNTATNGTPPISSFMDYSARLQAQGTKITGVDYGYSTPTSDDLTTMTYGRALFLLSWDGTAGSAYFFRRCGVNDTAEPQWTASVGLPTGPVQTDSSGILTRTFQYGTVVLNPNRNGSAARVSVAPGLHTMSGATEDGGVYVAPQTAAILSS